MRYAPPNRVATSIPLLCGILLLAFFQESLLATQPVRVVATGGRIGYTFYSPATGNTSFRHRSPHKLGGPISEIQIGFMDWMYTDKTEMPNADNEVTITQAWLERASTGQVVPLTFSGSRQLVLPPNSTTPYWLSDAVPSSVWSGSTPSRDEVFWLNVRGFVPEGGKLPVGTPTTYSGAKFVVYPPANDPGTFDTAGAVPTISGTSARTEGLPVVFLGRFTGPGHLAVIGIGDSILHGSGDSANPVPVVSGYGFFNRAAVDANGSNTIAMFNLTRHGQTASAWVSPSKQSRQAPFLRFANVVVEEYGTNDLGSGGTGDTSGILTRLETIWTTARQAGVQKIVRTLLLPRTSSNDSWATLAGQTPNVGWETHGKRDTINSGLQSALTSGKVDSLVDSLAVLGNPGDSSRWLTNGNSKYTTTDGTHVSPAGNALLGSALRSALLALRVDDYSAWKRKQSWHGRDPSPGASSLSLLGWKNLHAYAQALPPTHYPPPDSLPCIVWDQGTGTSYFSFRETTLGADLIRQIEASSNLLNWERVQFSDSELEILDSDPDLDGQAVRRGLPLIPSQNSRFYRIRWSL